MIRFTSLVGRAALLAALSGFSARAQKLDQLVPRNATAKEMTYQGRPAIQLTATPEAANGTSYAVVKDATFRDGVIEVNVAGKPARGAGTGARGFIGIAFRLQGDSYEYIYLRPTNGRAGDQVRRNHSTQYGSHPDFDFARLRRESPEKYESYVDLQPGVWTKYKIEVNDRSARLYVNGAEQPCLVVDDMKLAPRDGGIALWVGPGTEGYFEGLRVNRGGTGDSESRKIYFDRAHGEGPWPPQMAEMGSRQGWSMKEGTGPVTAEAVAGSRLIYLRAPNAAFQEAEKQAIVSFVKQGGSLLVVLDEEQRQKLAVVGVNDVIEAFGLKLSGDTPRIPNTGAVAKAGEINRADREIPYDGGRQVFGGTPFTFQLDREGRPAQSSAAYVKVSNGGRAVVMGEGMASLFLGTADATRMQLESKSPKWWGKDSQVYMEEVLSWLLAR